MATLTTEEIAYVRLMSGDDCTPYDVGDTLMQWLYDNKAGNDQCALIVWVLRARESKSAVLTNESSEGQSKSLSQKHAHIRAMRQDWEERCGMSGGTLDMAVFDLNIDSDCTDASEYQSRLEWLS